uniref:Sas10 domain-containing protein n=1 Tax=Syphacia muris TaxID=451379 RepID=A0A0N5B0B7_9BILA
MKYRKPKWNESDDDGDEVYDEIDRFHMSRDSGLNEVASKSQQKEEVLNVEGDTSEEDESDVEEADDNSDMSDFDSPAEDIESALPSADKWTKKKSQFYGTSYVDQDWGGMNEAEMEAAEFEEQDATERQKNLDATLSFLKNEQRAEKLNYKATDGELDLPSDDTVEMTEDEILDKFSELNPDFKQMLKEYSEKRKVFSKLIKPLKEAVTNIDKRETVTEQMILLAYNVYVSYLVNIMYYFRLKLTTGLKSKEAMKLLDDHPVIDAIIDEKKMLLTIDSFFEQNNDKVELILNSHQNQHALDDVFGAFDHSGDGPANTDEQQGNNEHVTADTSDMLDQSLDSDEADEPTRGEKRFVTAQIEKNKGLTSRKKKGTQHSRVKKRKQYEKALIKKRSQRPDIRRELEPYDGEKRGIRISTIKSVKLKA